MMGSASQRAHEIRPNARCDPESMTDQPFASSFGLHLKGGVKYRETTTTLTTGA